MYTYPVYAAPVEEAASLNSVIAEELNHPLKLLPLMLATSADRVAVAVVVGM